MRSHSALPGLHSPVARKPISNPRRHNCLQTCGHLAHTRHKYRSVSENRIDDSHKKASPLSPQQASLATSVLLISEVCRCYSAFADEAVPKYVPGPVQVGPEIWAGTIAATIPLVIGSWEFAKRIIIQRRCERCEGSGLVMKGRFARKCPECGGFFPWQGWRRFFTSTALPGNGGPLRQPRGQTSIFYRVPEDPRKANGDQNSVLDKGTQQKAGQKEEVDTNT